MFLNTLFPLQWTLFDNNVSYIKMLNTQKSNRLTRFISIAVSWDSCFPFLPMQPMQLIKFFAWHLFPLNTPFLHFYLTSVPSLFILLCILLLHLHCARGDLKIRSCPPSEAISKTLLFLFCSLLLVLRIEVWVPSHLGGGAAVQTTLEMISVPDTGRLSMHRMRSQTRWSAIGLRVWLHMPCVCPQICLHAFARKALACFFTPV